MRGRNDAFSNCIANPVISHFDVFRALVYRVVKINQSDSALVVDVQVDRFVGNNIELLEKNTKPGGRLSLGAEGVLPSRHIESFLRVFKQFTHNLPAG